MKNALSMTLLGGCALLLGACSTDLQKSQAAAPPAGSEFNRALSGYYRDMGPNQWDGQRDFQGSEHFARKSMAAGRNETVMPDNVVPTVPVRLEAELVSARARLITAFNNDATTRLPTTAARAQAAFDCWLDEANDPQLVGAPPNPTTVEPWLQSKVQNCRDSYYAAVSELEARPVAAVPAAAPSAVPPVMLPAARQQAYITFFDFDEATVTTEGVAVLRSVSDEVRRGNIVNVTVTGNTDRSGTDAYNMALSQRRAEAVKAMLIRSGVSSHLIAIIARGETQPLVATADGMREPQNRNVAVFIK